MSSVSIAGDTSGSILLAAPSVAGSSTLTLPTTGGTVLSTKTAGTVLQVVVGSFASTTSTTSTSYVDTNLSASITPSSATNKILVQVAASITQVTSGNSARFVIDRNGTKPQDPNFIQSAPVVDGTTLAFSYLDSPASTSALTYKVQMRNEAGGYTTIFGNESSGGYTYNTITLMEVVA